MKKIKRNVIKCTHCGDVIESKHVHDFKWCSCKTVAVDGGKFYCRRSFKNSPDDFEDLSEWEEEVEEFVHAYWKKVCNENVYWYECSACGEENPRNKYGHDYFSTHCPRCGAHTEFKSEATDVGDK